MPVWVGLSRVRSGMRLWLPVASLIRPESSELQMDGWIDGWIIGWAWRVDDYGLVVELGVQLLLRASASGVEARVWYMVIL